MSCGTQCTYFTHTHTHMVFIMMSHVSCVQVSIDWTETWPSAKCKVSLSDLTLLQYQGSAEEAPGAVSQGPLLLIITPPPHPLPFLGMFNISASFHSLVLLALSEGKRLNHTEPLKGSCKALRQQENPNCMIYSCSKALRTEATPLSLRLTGTQTTPPSLIKLLNYN